MKEEVIIAVQCRPPLWDKKHKHHHNRHILDREWKEVAKELNTTEKNVKGIWKNLRQEFRKQIKKTSTKSGAAAPETPTWKYFNALEFLQDQFMPRKSSGNLTVSTEVNDDSNDDEMEEGAEIGEEEVVSPSAANPPVESDSQVLPTCNAPQQQAPRTAGPATININSCELYSRTGFKKRMTTQAAIGHELVQLEKEKLKLKKNKAEENRNDEDVGFFNSLLPHVSTLDPRKKMVFRMNVQKLLFEMAYSEPSQLQYTAPSPTLFSTTSSLRSSPYDTSSSSTVTSPVDFTPIGNEQLFPTYTNL